MTRLLVGCVTACLSVALSAAPAGATSAKTQKLSEVLDQLQERGVPILYSRRLVRPDMTVDDVPETAPAVSLITLNQLLAPHQLEVKIGPKGAFMVVPRSFDAKETASEPEIENTTPVPTAPIEMGYTEAVDVSATTEIDLLGSDGFVLDGKTVADIPGAVNNVYRTLDTLSGVNTTGELGSGLSVRGAAPQDTLILMDGVEIYKTMRLYGVVNSFYPQVVDKFQLSKGGFDARYGDRTTSLLEVENRAGTRNEWLRGTFDFNLAEAALVLEGKLPDGKGSWIASGRRTYYDWIAEASIQENFDFPSFSDLQTKWFYEPRPGHRLAFTGLVSREGTRLQPNNLDRNDPDYDRDSFLIGQDSDTRLFALNYDVDFTAATSLHTTVSRYELDDAFSLLGDVESGTRVSRHGDLERTITFERHVTLRDWALRQSFAFSPREGHSAEVGYDLHFLDTGWKYDTGFERTSGLPTNASISLGTQGFPGSALPAHLDSTIDAVRWGAFARDGFDATEKLHLEVGLRFERSSVNTSTTASPRLRATYQLGSRSTLYGTFGLFYQSPGYEKMFLADDFVDLSREAERDVLASERNVAYELGISHHLAPGLDFRLEAYHRSLDNILSGRLETNEERNRRLSLYDYPPELQSEIPTNLMQTVRPASDASGSAWGLDVTLARTRQSSEKLTGWLSYSFGHARENAYGIQFPFRYDRTHAAAAVGTYALTPSISFSATAKVMSGFARTAAIGTRVAAVDNGDALVPQRDRFGNLVYTQDFGPVTNLNQARQPSFARLDLRFNYRTGGGEGRWLWYVEVLNVLNRANTLFVDPSIRFVRGVPVIDEQFEQSIPIVPLFGFRFQF